MHRRPLASRESPTLQSKYPSHSPFQYRIHPFPNFFVINGRILYISSTLNIPYATPRPTHILINWCIDRVGEQQGTLLFGPVCTTIFPRARNILTVLLLSSILYIHKYWRNWTGFDMVSTELTGSPDKLVYRNRHSIIIKAERTKEEDIMLCVRIVLSMVTNLSRPGVPSVDVNPRRCFSFRRFGK